MKTKSILQFTLAIIFLSSLFISCTPSCNEDGSLDEVKAFVPTDKYFKSSLKSLHFVLETSPIDEVDKLFSQLIELQSLPHEPSLIADGTYTGESPYDAFDYKHVVILTIKNGKIVNVIYNEIHKNGSDKKTDKKYNEEMSVSGTSPSIAYPNMEKQIIKKQDMLQVDATSGATYSLYRFRYAITLALMKAKLAENKV